MLAFSYQQVSLTTTPQSPNGAIGTPVTFSWDVATSTEDVNIPNPVTNHSPVAVDDAANATTGIGGTATGNVLANDSDADGDSLTVTPFVGVGAHGKLTLNADGSFNYIVTDLTGPTGSHLHDVFSYNESDGRGGIASADLDVALNRAPVVLNNTAGLKIGTTSSGNVLANDTDPDGDQLSVTAIDGGNVGNAINGTYGTLVLNSNGSYSYTAIHGAGGSTAVDVFHFTESDGHGGVVQSTLAFTVISNGQTYLAGTPGQTITGGNGKGVLDGSLGGQHLAGGNGADALVGGNGDVLTGGNGPDQFVFKGNFGGNEITDFSHNDTLQLDKSTFGSVNDILTHYAANDGHGNTTITDPTDPANFIILDHIGINQLRGSDFVLV
ncbi:hypothetical protein GWG65_39245 [Bradyrhizobium sp. CSA207]|nr:hypothetical protein [Bradyrhizobium sp. CSA207]